MGIIKDHDKYPQARFSPSHSLSICHNKYGKIEGRIQHQIASTLEALPNNYNTDKRHLARATIQEMDQP
jgi:hypothetical protein